MINKFKTFAMAMMATGATVIATNASAVTDTNTFTNVIQAVTFSLTVSTNSPIKNSTTQTGGKSVSLTTKSILTALSNASGSIPSLKNFNWGKSPQLVINTTFASTNTISNTVTPIATNTVTLTVSNDNVIVFQPTNSTFPGSETNGSIVVATNGSATITNVSVGTNGGTNTISTTGGFDSSGSVTNASYSYIGTNGLTNASVAIPTNLGVWTIITAATNSNGATNVTATTYTNVPHTLTNFVTNSSGFEVQGGTATAPTFADVSQYIYNENLQTQVTVTAAGTGLGTTNEHITSATKIGNKYYGIDVYNTDPATAIGNNLQLNLYGFGKMTYGYDVLAKGKTFTNQVIETTAAVTLYGFGYIGGSYATNASGTNAQNVNNYGSEYINDSVTNITGIITNPIPIVVEGTVTIGNPKSVAQ